MHPGDGYFAKCRIERGNNMKEDDLRAGFTMVEVVISLALAVMVSIVLMTIYFTAYRIVQYQIVFTDIQYAERAAMQMMIEDIMAAQQVAILDDGNQLRLKIDDNDVSYYLQSQSVYRQGKAKMPVANDISSLSFQVGSSPGWINICLEAQQGPNLNRIKCAAVPRMMNQRNEPQ